MNCRSLRLTLVRGLAIVLLVPALAVAVAHAQAPTVTTLTAGTLNGCAQPLSIAVTANDQPVTGVVAVEDEYDGQQVQLDSLQLSSAGAASPTIFLATGTHTLTAVFAATSSNQSSTSSPVSVNITAQCRFMAAVSYLAPATTPVNTLTAGQSGTATVSILPNLAYTSTLATPMFVTLSCSGLPENATCTFSPKTVEILSTTTAPVTSSMAIQTVAQTTSSSSPVRHRPGGGSHPVAWAFLLPGALGLGGLAWGARRRRWLSRISLLLLVGLMTMLGTTACNPLYGYKNYGPYPNPATPSGTYAVTVAAESTNGVTTATYTTSLALTVQ
ncbi:MAG: hypothetical protein ACP5FH_01240 [Terracidiphilus sp.]